MTDASDTLNYVGFFQELKAKNKFKEIFGYIKQKINNNNAFELFKNY